jgi:hypothetical protein
MAGRFEPETPPINSEQAARAFISYASQDKAVADALGRSLVRHVGTARLRDSTNIPLPATSGPTKVQTHDQKAAVDFRYRLIHYGDDI